MRSAAPGPLPTKSGNDTKEKQRMVNKITALMVAWVAGVNTRIRQPDKEAEVGGVGEYAALVGLGVAAVVGVFAVYNGWLDGIMGGLPNP